MEDEKYVFFQDVREKKVTGYSARKQRSHCGKGGRVKLPSDYLTKKELKNMSGECRSYRLNDPMKWAEFKAMPDDIQETYLKILREKYDVSDTQLSKMFGTSQGTCCQYLKKKGFSRTGHHSGAQAWDKEGFYAWAYGVPKTEECQSVQEEVKEEISVEEDEEILDILGEEQKEEQAVVEEEIPVEKKGRWAQIPSPGIKIKLVDAAKEPAPAFAIPSSGSMNYEGDALDILRSISRLLGGAKVALNISWDVVED